jgi:ubiquinone/menaquinone biosynthesis C-methylase UbiE
MKTESIKVNETNAANAFGRQSSVFDVEYSDNKIVDYKRARVRAVLEKNLPVNSNILELNSGTGDDAIWLAQKGHYVHATDISDGMQNMLKQKVIAVELTANITTEICSFNDLNTLANKQLYDCIFSNFAGLNCAENLAQVLEHFSGLVKQNGIVTLVIMPKFSLWEFLLAFKGEFKLAFRRLTSTKKYGAKAHIMGQYFRCWYYNPSYVINCLKKDFSLLQLEGMCTIVPPSFIENFPIKYPKSFQFLIKLESQLKSVWPFTIIGDYYIITLKKL